jgi:hypothetical protein
MIEAEVKKRDIKHVLHFTQIENLQSIIQHGLLPKHDLDSCGIPYQFNDQMRIDNCDNAICLSISWPNYKMFYSYRKQNPIQDWIVISILPKVLWEKECAFCYSNAACSEIVNIPLEDRKKPEAFLKMFSDFDEYPKRYEMPLKDSFPTNPQAEVLVFDVVECQYIQSILFEKKDNGGLQKKNKRIEKISMWFWTGAFFSKKRLFILETERYRNNV